MSSCYPVKVKPPAKPPAKRPCKKSSKVKNLPYQKPIREPPLFEPPSWLRAMGPKHISILSNFIPSALWYTLGTAILTIYCCEWKTVLQYLPYYNGKYLEEQMQQSDNLASKSAQQDAKDNGNARSAAASSSREKCQTGSND